MTKAFIPTIIGLVVITATGGLVYVQSQKTSDIPTQETLQKDIAHITYTIADVATHTSESDCWSVINGSVYNLTQWIARHPGGKQAILGLCGKDGSAAFNGQHGGGASQAAILAEMKVGVLAQ